MYVVSFGQRAETATTLAGVLYLLNGDRESTGPRLEETTVRHVEPENVDSSRFKFLPEVVGRPECRHVKLVPALLESRTESS